MELKGWIILVGVLALVMIVEKIVAVRKNINTYSFSDIMSNLSCGILERLVAFFWYFVFFQAAVYVFNNVALWHIPTNPFTWFIALVVTDFVAYWHHRLSHEVNFLWAAHIVHHQSEDVNVSTVFRVSFFAVFNRSLFFIWMPVVGFDPIQVLQTMVFLGAFQFITHSRLIGKLGFLEKIFSTPSNHRVHHSRNEKYIDHNYGHIFMIWDRMFKTYTPEEEEPEYGITTGFESESAFNSNFFYWKDLFKRASMTASFKDKIKLFFAKPEWTPRDVGYLPDQYKKDEQGNRLVHAVPMSRPFGIYMLVNNLLTLAFFISMFGLIDNPKEAQFSDLWYNKHLMVLVGTILLSVLVQGRFMDQKAGSKILDSIRLIVIAAGIPFVYSEMAGNWFEPAVWIYCGVMMVWLWFNKETHLPRSGYVKPQAV